MSTTTTRSTDVFRLPDVGEGLTEAEIVGWRVSAGQQVAVNDVLVEIETAKSLVELPSPVDGVVGELLVAEGDTVEVGSPIVRFGTAAAAPADAPADAASADHGPADPASADHGPADAGTPGGADEPVQPVAPARTSAVPGTAPAEGTPTEPLQPVTEPVRSANLVGYGAKQGAASGRRRRLSVASFDPAPAQAAAPGRSASSDRSTPPRPGGSDGLPATGGPLAKPPVRRLARELGVELSEVSATGPGGTVTREDVSAHARARSTAPGIAQRLAEPDASGVVDPDGGETRIAVRSVRRMTADAMTASAFSAPHVTEFLDVDVTRSYRLLDRLRARKDFAGLKVSVVLLVAKAMCLAAQRTPEVNASWDGPNNEIVLKHAVNLGIAAATPRGLLVPNVKNAQTMPLPRLCQEINDLVATARAGRTTPEQMTGGTITLTNVGVFGVDTGTPILNPGESAILAVGTVGDRPWVHKGKVRPRKVMTLALSFDHRIVDGEQGSRFLADVGVILSDPATSLLWT